MPNNDNNFNELPRLNNEPQNPVNNNPGVAQPQPMPQQQPVNPTLENAQPQSQKQIIEIPQEYYEKVRKEKQESANQEINDQRLMEENREANKKLVNILVTAIFGCALVFGGLYLAFKVKDIAIFIIPIVAIIGTVISSVSAKKESAFHTSILVGGMIAAVIAYVLCVTHEQTADYWMHYAVSCAVAAFACYIVCAIIHTLITNRENVKALGMLAMVLFLVAIVAVPLYFYKKYPDEMYKAIFMKNTEVHAETEEEFITKTLKNRYGTDFKCSEDDIRVGVEDGRKHKHRFCYPASSPSTEFVVENIYYKESDNLHIVLDNYMDVIKFDSFRSTLAQNIMTATGAKEVIVYMYPKANCRFIADCADCKEYFENREKEDDIDSLYKASSTLDYSKLVNKDALSIANEIEVKYVIQISGSFSAEYTNLDEVVNRVLDYLNRAKVQNNYGYDITLYHLDTQLQQPKQKVYMVSGDASNDKTFKDPKVQKLS